MFTLQFLPQESKGFIYYVFSGLLFHKPASISNGLLFFSSILHAKLETHFLWTSARSYWTVFKRVRFVKTVSFGFKHDCWSLQKALKVKYFISNVIIF